MMKYVLTDLIVIVARAIPIPIVLTPISYIAVPVAWVRGAPLITIIVVRVATRVRISAILA